jgi:cellobiose phosphorylase
MRYGRFSEDGREFIIENVATPRPWINYLYNEEYFTFVSQNGGGMSYHRIPLYGRITRYRINDVPPDRPGKYIYVCDGDTGEFWSLTWQPVGRGREAYRAVHGFGWTRVEARIARISSEVTYFVAPDENTEIWWAKLANRSEKPRRLSIIGYVEFCLGHALIDLINQSDDQHFNRVHFDPALNALFATKTYWVTETRGTQHQENKEWDQWVFFTASEPVSEYETLRERFTGIYGNESNPQALKKGELSSKDTDFGNAVGALKLEINLAAGESKDVIFALGVVPKDSFEKDKGRRIKRFLNAADAGETLERVKKQWENILGAVTVNTPDPDANIYLNCWTPYQARVAFDIGRVASFYYWGIGRGLGFRDTAQDTIAVTIASPEKARERVLLLSRQMFRDGRVYHHFYRDGQGELTDHADDPLWFILAVTEYVKETGEPGILEAVESFADGGSGTILDHLRAVVRFAEARLGPHGLPIFGRGDWNDTLDYIGGDEGGESVWAGMFYAAMLDRLAELLEFIGEIESAEQAAALRDQFRQAANDHGWDGEWYIRAFGEKGRKIGSRENIFGKIFINTQSWAVIASVAGRDRLSRAMDSVLKQLDTAYGPKLCAPAFREIDPTIGLITRCVAGKKENAAVFLHPTAWVIQAECLLGRGREAWRYYKKLLPNAIDQDIFKAEPYVYSQYITSDEHPSAGSASHSWQTGTAAWMFRVMIDYAFGVRPEYAGLRIDPVIPPEWERFSIERTFRGTRYAIEVENPDHIEYGVREIVADGAKIQGQVLPLSPKAVCHVKVIMGKK